MPVIKKETEVKMENPDIMDNNCPVCHDPIEVYAIGVCDHPVCYVCSTRMRVLCEQNECPICRGLMPQVAMVTKRKLFKDISLRDSIPNRKYKIFYENEDVEEMFLLLLEYKCKIAPYRKFQTFNQLQTYMRREHQLFACDLCLNTLKIFPFERKFYSRKDLATHRRVGDPDDKSYKGHPLCEFCDTRFFDKDELWKHLRKDHFYCHFCDQNGSSNTFYDQYPDLLRHFEDTHYVCKEGECGNSETRFTHAFVSEIDLKAHKAQCHNHNLSKAQVRETRTIEVDFHLAPRPRPNRRGAGINSNDYEGARSSHGGRRNDRRGDGGRRVEREDEDLARALEASRREARPSVEERVPDPVTDFPTLSGAPAPTPVLVAAPRTREDDFPSLASAGKRGNIVPAQMKSSSKAYSTVTHKPQPTQQTQAPAVKKESKPVSLGPVPNVASDRWRAPASVTEDDYPSLGVPRTVPSNPTPNVTTVNWIEKTAQNGISGASGRGAVGNKKTMPNRTFRNDVQDFPSLGGGVRTENTNKKLFSERSKSKPQDKKQTTPRSQKFEEDFELPDYYKKENGSVSPPNSLASIAQEVSKVSIVEPQMPNGVNDFPDLQVKPKVEKIAPSNEKKANKKKNKKKNDSQKNVDESGSLNDIAQGLLGPDKKPEAKTKVNGNKAAKKPEKTDWFDNPPEEVTYAETKIEKDTPKIKDNKKVKEETTKTKPKVKEEITDNFPSLHSMSSSVKEPKMPPGFKQEPEVEKSKPQFKPAPPGFTSAIDRPKRAGPVGPYIQPPDFKQRNLKLIEEIKRALSTVEDGFSTFRALSMTYRQNQMDPSEYYFNCQHLMGQDDFAVIFPELLVLLPDVDKQLDLFEIYKIAGNPLPLSNLKGVSSCPICGQVVMTADVPHHRVQHGELGLSDSFPSLAGGPQQQPKRDSRAARQLGTAAAATAAGKGAWIRAT